MDSIQFNDYIKRGAEELLERSTENIRYSFNLLILLSATDVFF